MSSTYYEQGDTKVTADTVKVGSSRIDLKSIRRIEDERERTSNVHVLGVALLALAGLFTYGVTLLMAIAWVLLGRNEHMTVTLVTSSGVVLTKRGSGRRGVAEAERFLAAVREAIKA